MTVIECVERHKSLSRIDYSCRSIEWLMPAGRILAAAVISLLQ